MVPFGMLADIASQETVVRVHVLSLSECRESIHKSASLLMFVFDDQLVKGEVGDFPFPSELLHLGQ